jgi:hypothetical protein
MVGVPEIADLILSAFKVSTPRAHRPAPPRHDAQSAPVLARAQRVRSRLPIRSRRLGRESSQERTASQAQIPQWHSVASALRRDLIPFYALRAKRTTHTVYGVLSAGAV